MQLKSVIIFAAIWTAALSTADKTTLSKGEEKYGDINSQSKTFNRFADLTPASSDYLAPTAQFNPYGDHSAVNYGVAPVHQPSFGIAVNTQATLAPHLDILHLIEAFVKLTGEIVARFHVLINENWETIKTLLNFVVIKIQKLHIILLKGIGVVRTIIEFAFKLFSNWSFTLPSLTLGSVEDAATQSQDAYGYGISANVANFLEAMKTL